MTYYLARLLYDRSVAVGTLMALLLLSTHPPLHPLFMGRTVLAEMPMLFYLLSGYVFFLLTFHKPWFILFALFCWGVSLITKAQVLPFWTISLFLPLMIMLRRRDWKAAGLLAVSLGGSLLASRMLLWLQQLLLQVHTLPNTPPHGVYDFTALVPLMPNRLHALEITLVTGLPTLLSLFYAAWKYIKNSLSVSPGEVREVVRLALIFLTGSWFAWY